MKKDKKKLLVSFSGGETSAFMAQWIKKNMSDEYDIIFVFANTGEENDNTLDFVNKVDKYFNLGVVWVESVVNHGVRKSSSFKVVSYENHSKNGEPFEEMIKKYGIPNQGFPHCTRELKTSVIRAYAKSVGWKGYYTAIGIRADEIDRISEKKEKEKLIYPLVKLGTTKPIVNFFWRAMPFRLELKGYEDNCKVCWKKTLRKLLTIARHHPERFDNFKKWEADYGYFIPVTQSSKRKGPLRFNRKNISVEELLLMAKTEKFDDYKDDRQIYPDSESGILKDFELDISNGCSESCEVF